MSTNIKICGAECCYEREPLKSAFGFKGSALSCLWQTVVRLESEGRVGIGLGVQSVLWSDSAVFHRLGEEEGNRAMFRLTEYAVSLCRGMEIEDPFALLDALFPKVYAYAKQITGTEELRTTFVLNALVPLDFAAWQLWAKANGKVTFDDICRFDGGRQQMLANVPLITYSTPIEDVRRMAENGTALFKIKIGSDPKKDNDPDAMLSWDQNRLLEIHRAVKDLKTPYTENGNILYYLDANGRYDTKERLAALLDFASAHGILERVVLLEEPFDEGNKIDVHDLPVCLAADESAHSLEDVKERFALGYRALTLKPIAKTLSMTIRMADYARSRGMICFCADLTVNPIMVSWNQCVAARLQPIGQMRIGVVESNGEQNYVNWESMRRYHPLHGERFTACENGVFHLTDSFYEQSGGIFVLPKHYGETAWKEGV